VANRWCELLPMPLEPKQRLMARDNPLLQLELVSDILGRTGISLTSDGKRLYSGANTLFASFTGINAALKT
jgi:hypothetical protein